MRRDKTVIDRKLSRRILVDRIGSLTETCGWAIAAVVGSYLLATVIVWSLDICAK